MQRMTQLRLPPPRAPQPVSPLVAGLCDQLAAEPLFGGEPVAELLDIADQCREPLRVAVAGDVSTGKSTLVNALLRIRRATMAREETTARVTSYRHPSLPPPRALVSGHEYEPVPFPHCDRLTLIDTPGLNSPSGIEHITREMITGATRAAGATAVLLYLCKNCLFDEGARSHIEDFATLTAGRIGWGLNVVLVGAKADSIQGSRAEIQENLLSDAGIPCASAIAVSQQPAMAARTGMLEESQLDTLRTLAQHDDLALRIQHGWTTLARVWAAAGFDPAALRQLSELTESRGLLHHSVTEIREQRVTSVIDMIRAWEEYSGLAALERLLARFADESDMFTVHSTTGRIRRLALRLGRERGRILRARLAELQRSSAYSALARREAAAVLQSGALSDIPVADRVEAAEMLRAPTGQARPSLARTWQRLAIHGPDSLTKQIAGVVVEASLNPA
jgi:hypothetical protein